MPLFFGKKEIIFYGLDLCVVEGLFLHLPSTLHVLFEIIDCTNEPIIKKKNFRPKQKDVLSKFQRYCSDQGQSLTGYIQLLVLFH
jgi:hypothetical protein